MHRKMLLAFIICLALWSQPGECQYDVWHAVDEAFVVCPPLPEPNPLPDGMTSAQWPKEQKYPVTIAYDHGLAEDKWHVVTFFRQHTGVVNITFDVKDNDGQTVIERTTVKLGVEVPSDCKCTGDNGRVDKAKYGNDYGKTCNTWDSTHCATWNNETGAWCCKAWCYVSADCKDAQSSIFNPGAYYSYKEACGGTADASPCSFADADPCTCTNVDTISPYAESGRAAIEGAGYGASCATWSYAKACGDAAIIAPNMTDIWCCQSWCWVQSAECESSIPSDLYPGIYWSRAKCPDDETLVNTCPWKAKTSHDPVPTPAPPDSSCACLGFMPKTMTSGRRRAGKAWPSGYGATCAAHDKTECDKFFKQMTPGIWCCQRWCYVDESCPSANPSSIANGYYWSREACPDDPSEMENCAFSTVCKPSTTTAPGLDRSSFTPNLPTTYGAGCGTHDKDNCWPWWGSKPNMWSTTNNNWCCQSWTYLDEGCPLGLQGLFGKSYSYEMCTNTGPQVWKQASKTCAISRRLDAEASDAESGLDGETEDQGASDEEHDIADENEKESTEEGEGETENDEEAEEEPEEEHKEGDAEEEREEDGHEEGEEDAEGVEEEREEDGHEEGGEDAEDVEEEREEDGHEEDAKEDEEEEESEQMQEQAPQPNLRASFAAERVLAPSRRRSSSSRRRTPPGRRRAPSRISPPDYRRRAASSGSSTRRRMPSSLPPGAPARRRANTPSATSGRRRTAVPSPTPPPPPPPTPKPTPAPSSATGRRRSPSAGDRRRQPASSPRRRRSPATPPPPPPASQRRRQATAARRRASITPATSQRRRAPGGNNQAAVSSRRRQVGSDGRAFESPRRRRSPSGSSPPANSGRRRASVGYTNQNTLNNNYNGKMPSKTAYGHTGVAKPAGSTAKIALAAAAGVAGGAVLGAGAYYAYSRYNQDTADGGAGAGAAFQDNQFCQVPSSDTVNKGKLIRCDDCISAYGSSCKSLSACYSDDGCDYTLPDTTIRDDIMTASFLPSEWVGPLTLTVYEINGTDYTPAKVCPPLPNATTDGDGNVTAAWKKAASVNTDLFVTFAEVGALDQDSEPCVTDTKQPCRGASKTCGTNEQCTDGYCECKSGWCMSANSVAGKTAPACTTRFSGSGTTNAASQAGANLLLVICLLAVAFLRGRHF